MSSPDRTPPLATDDWETVIGLRPAEVDPGPMSVEFARLAVQPGDEPAVRFRPEASELIITSLTTRLGAHRFPPAVSTIPLAAADLSGAVRETEGRRWPFLPVRPRPAVLPGELRVQPTFPRLEQRQPGDGRGDPTSVFVPDGRTVFADTSFPWSTCGRVAKAGGWASGVMVGPRHLLTASHVVNWQPNNTAGWMTFTPMQFDTSTPFGSANVSQIYWWKQADNSDGIDEEECAFDYVVCELDRRLGDLTGWVGSREYSTSWDGTASWGHVGYPQDISGGLRPTYITGPIDSEFTRSLSGRSSFGLKHRIDAVGGQSGGPYLGWWDGEDWPRVVATQSAENWDGPGGPNTAGGGGPLPELISYAITQAP